MKINWKVRAKNPVFWITLIPAVISAVYGVLAVIGIVPRIAEDTLISAFTGIVGLLSTLGIIADPTTKGIKDSTRAMGYNEPYEEEKGGSVTFSQFIKNHLGKGVDVDGAAGIQCVDLIKAYLKEIFGIKAGAWGNARHYFECFNDKSWGGYTRMHEKFDRIKNTPELVPLRGDICVWGEGVSDSHDCGHIALATGEGDTRSFYTYDQNWGGKACKKVKHRYTSEDFLGVLRPKRTTTANLNVRKGPGTNYAKVDLLKNGTTVSILEQRGNWFKIGENRWVSASYIEEL